MGAITGMLGVGGGAGGTGFGGPSMANQQGNNNMQAAFDQLQKVASGQGPNPAMAKYNENVQNLAKQQAGAISSIQGISPALAARMISQQGSGALQNAAAQGAVTQAEQQLGALGQMGNIGAAQQGAANQMQANINQANTGLAQTTMQGQQGFIGGLFGGAGSAMGAMAAAEGLDTENMPTSHVEGSDLQIQAQKQTPQSSLSRFLQGNQNGVAMSPGAAITQGMTTFGEGLGKQLYVPKPAALQAKGGEIKDFRSGGNVKATNPAQKAVKSGNSYANDKIPAVLSEGEVVIPRNVMQSPDPIRASADFVANVIAKRRNSR